mgnify:CR=1 FL=1
MSVLSKSEKPTPFMGGSLSLEDSLIKEHQEKGFVIKELPLISWSEIQIKNYIEKNKFPVKYDIKNQTKKQILEELKEKGLI